MTNKHKKGSSRENQSRELLELIGRLTEELHPDLHPATVTLDNSLDRDLGLDSLARMELLSRLENHFHIRLPEQVFVSAETPRDLLRQLDRQIPSPETKQIHEHIEIHDTSQIIPVPGEAKTLVEVLHHHASSHGDQTHIVLEGHKESSQKLTYGELYKEALQVAAGLQQYDLNPDDTVAIVLPTGLEYFCSFFGVLLAGGVPVPLYPPVRPSQIEEHLRRHAAILQNASSKILITMPEVKPAAKLLKLQVPEMEHIKTVSELKEQRNQHIPVPLQPGDIAFLQYTSGSTGDPKGVILTHTNLLENIRAMGQVTKVTAADVFVSWLPLYHDMGLIGAWLGSLYFGCKLVIMPPLTFLARPERWLWAIHNHRGTLSASPNFGYELCCRRIKGSDIKDLDLSCWRRAFNGAEPIIPQAINNFCDHFAAYGFKKESMAPVYGLAESSVGLAFPPLNREPIIDRIDRDIFSRTGKAVPAPNGKRSALEFVACGHPLPGHQIRIVDKNDRELPERKEGKLQFKGPSATTGYFMNPDKTRDLFLGDWLDSGDLAYIAAGDVFITGRIKDVIIRGGRNIYPHELEEAVGNISGIRSGSIAVFGSSDKTTGTERLIIMAESRKKDPYAIKKLQQKVNDLSIDILGMPPDEVVIVPPGTVLKTSSGKIRRASCRKLFEDGDIGKTKKSVWLQVTKIILSGLLPQTRKLLQRTGDFAFATYSWTIFWMLCPLVWLLTMLLPIKKWCWRVTRAGARLLALLTGTKLTVQGAEYLCKDQPVIITSNHMSYLDAYVFQAILPFPCSFIAKAELLKKPLIWLPLKKLGAIPVKRFDRQQILDDTRQIAQLTQKGYNILFFPEGTFQRMPGLLPFRMGAFQTATQSGVPVVPVTLRGTRNILRSDSWFPRRGIISVHISQPVWPDGKDWKAAIRLKDKVRREILNHLGEPDLAGSYETLADLKTNQDS